MKPKSRAITSPAIAARGCHSGVSEFEDRFVDVGEVAAR